MVWVLMEFLSESLDWIFLKSSYLVQFRLSWAIL